MRTRLRLALPLFFVVVLPPRESWPYIFTSCVIHIAYYIALVGAYRHGGYGARGALRGGVDEADRSPEPQRADAERGVRRGHLEGGHVDRAEGQGQERLKVGVLDPHAPGHVDHRARMEILAAVRNSVFVDCRPPGSTRDTLPL